ncbi:hypothetical protein HY629_02710 [Candidatus Uhrbacteria bacterium]|nr:hypothetical protein [Candidatus Uhrbacteria bacterium]
MQRRPGVPTFLQSALWSVNVRALDPKKDKRYIIEQILNYGTWRQLQWLLKTYATREIRHMLRNPSRGIWHDEVLTYWEKILNTKVESAARERAIFSLEPRYLPLPHAKTTR